MIKSRLVGRPNGLIIEAGELFGSFCTSMLVMYKHTMNIDLHGELHNDAGDPGCGSSSDDNCQSMTFFTMEKALHCLKRVQMTIWTTSNHSKAPRNYQQPYRSLQKPPGGEFNWLFGITTNLGEVFGVGGILRGGELLGGMGVTAGVTASGLLVLFRPG